METMRTNLHHVSPGFVREVQIGSEPPSLGLVYVIRDQNPGGKLGLIGDDLIQLN